LTDGKESPAFEKTGRSFSSETLIVDLDEPSRALVRAVAVEGDDRVRWLAQSGETVYSTPWNHYG